MARARYTFIELVPRASYAAFYQISGSLCYPLLPDLLLDEFTKVIRAAMSPVHHEKQQHSYDTVMI